MSRDKNRKKRKKMALPLSDLVSNVLQQEGVAKQYVSEMIRMAWPEVVGDNIAKYSRAVTIKKDNSLVVEVYHPMWHQELTLHKEAILQTIDHQVGIKLSDIHFYSAQHQQSNEDEPPTTQNNTVSAKDFSEMSAFVRGLHTKKSK